MKPAIAFSIALLLGSAAFAGVGAGAPIPEGKAFEVPVGYGEAFAPGQLTLKDGVYHLSVTLAFIGAGGFSRTNAKEVATYTGRDPGADFFKKGVQSFDQHPRAKAEIEKIVAYVEKFYNTPKFKLHLSVEYPKDSTYLSKETLAEKSFNLYMMDVYSAMIPLSKKGVVPVVVTAIPSPDVATPNLWDAYSNPFLFAHEFGHLLGIVTEGYMLRDYPANGVMNDEYVFEAMKKKGLEGDFTLVATEFNEMMLSLLSRARPKLPRKALEKFFQPLNDIYKAGTNGYFELPNEEKIEIAEQKVKTWEAVRSSRCASGF